MPVERSRVTVGFVDKILDAKDDKGKDVKKTITMFTTCTKDTAEFFGIKASPTMEIEDSGSGETFIQVRRGSRHGRAFQVITSAFKRDKEGNDKKDKKGRSFSFQFPSGCTMIDIITFLKKGGLTKNKDKITGFVSPYGMSYSYEDKTATDDVSKATPRDKPSSSVPDSVDDGSK